MWWWRKTNLRPRLISFSWSRLKTPLGFLSWSFTWPQNFCQGKTTLFSEITVIAGYTWGSFEFLISCSSKSKYLRKLSSAQRVIFSLWFLCLCKVIIFIKESTMINRWHGNWGNNVDYTINHIIMWIFRTILVVKEISNIWMLYLSQYWNWNLHFCLLLKEN